LRILSRFGDIFKGKIGGIALFVKFGIRETLRSEVNGKRYRQRQLPERILMTIEKGTEEIGRASCRERVSNFV
jgi:hypothetical protein